MTKSLGFVGLGQMGKPMAGRLLDRGYSLTVFDARAEALEPFAARGASIAVSARDVADREETVLVSLPTPPVVEAVTLGPDGLSAGNAIKTFVDLSTTGPTVSARIGSALADKGIVPMDAPVSGGIGGAAKGTLAVMVSGPEASFQSLADLLQTFGKVFFVGEKSGLGQTMKLCNNYLSATAMAATTEAVIMGVKSGLDPKVMIDVINAGSGQNTASRDKFPQDILNRRFAYGFSTGLMHKDVALFVDEAGAAEVPVFVAGAVKQMWTYALSQAGPESDFTTIFKCLEDWVGIREDGSEEGR